MSFKNKGVFVPTTNVWDPGDIENVDVSSKEFKELLVRLYQNLNNISLALNLKDTGIYGKEEFVCGKTYFSDPTLRSTSGLTPNPRQVYRKVIDFGALPNNTSKSVAHGLTITSSFSYTDIYAVATDPAGSNGIKIPYASATAASIIELRLDGTNVIITTSTDRTAFTKTYVVIEYIKI